MFGSNYKSGAVFDALVVSLGRDYPIRIISWKYEGKTDSEWYDKFYEPNDSTEPDPFFGMVLNNKLRDGVDQKEADEILNTCQWIENHIGDIINRDEDQSHWVEEDQFDEGIFACRICINGWTDYWGEYDEDHEFLEVVDVTNMADWDKHFDQKSDLTQKG